MSAEISVVNGRAEMFSGNNVVPWHGLGTVVSGLLTAKEAIEAAHLDWKVGFSPITVNGIQLSQEEYQAVCRLDSMETLGIVKGRYELIQNSDCFDFMDSLVQDGALKYETAGALRGGKQIWMLAKYDGDLEIAGDAHEQWLLLVTSHDGSKCLEMLWTTVRVVCANTLSLALRGRKNSVKIRHAANWESKRNEAQRVLGLTKDYFGDMREQLAKLQDREFSQDDMNAFTALLYPAQNEKEVPTRTSNMRWGTARLFNREQTGTYGKTAWDALNAVTDYADHYSTIKGKSTRLESALMGSAAELKQKAFDLLTGEELTAQLIAAKSFMPKVAVETSPAVIDGGNEFARLLGQ